jgi:hypothetical protein
MEVKENLKLILDKKPAVLGIILATIGVAITNFGNFISQITGLNSNSIATLAFWLFFLGALIIIFDLLED